jgi:hypothetical protein
MYNISQVYYIIRPNNVMFYVGELITFRGISGDIRDNDTSFHGGKDTPMVLLHCIVFSFGRFDNRREC